MKNSSNTSIRRRLIFDTPEFTNTDGDIDAFLDTLQRSFVAKKSDKWNFDFFTGDPIVSENQTPNSFDWKLIPNKKFTVRTKKSIKNLESPPSSSSITLVSSPESLPLSEKENKVSEDYKNTPRKCKLKQTQIIKYMTSTHRKNRNGKKLENIFEGYITKKGVKKVKSGTS
uniref:CDI domain-containing protein n=1 Tax=Strongyloides papillosus TaxID=174720 RepID=A0A0N5BGI7_STREA